MLRFVVCLLLCTGLVAGQSVAKPQSLIKTDQHDYSFVDEFAISYHQFVQLSLYPVFTLKDCAEICDVMEDFCSGFALNYLATMCALYLLYSPRNVFLIRFI